MTAVGVSSGIFRDIFSTEPMRRIFADENRIQKYLDIEAALARAQARLGIIPQNACDEILRHCSIAEYDFAKLKTQTERIGYPVLPVVQQLVALCQDGLGEWCHWGATTQDITDTATVLQIREALDLIEVDLVAISDALAALAKRYRDTPMAGRSNLQQAVPITFGYKAATYLAGFERHLERLRELRPRVLVGEFGGAAGTLSSLGKRGLEVQAALMQELGLGQPRIAWHTVRDCIAEVGCFLGLVTGSCGKIAFDVKLMMQTEVEEVYEPFHEGRGSSITVPQIFSLAAGALAQTRFLVSGLQVDEKKMRANLDITRGLIVSEAVMMGLGPHIGRQYAHDLVYDICRQVIATGRPLVDLLAENQEIARHLDRASLEKLCDPAKYLGQAGA